jgi:hypothetical protein
MKKIRVTVIHEFEVPDDWAIASDFEGEPDCLLVGGRLLTPDIEWLQLDGEDADGTRHWEEAHDALHGIISQERISIEEIERLMYDDDEQSCNGRLKAWNRKD